MSLWVVYSQLGSIRVTYRHIDLQTYRRTDLISCGSIGEIGVFVKGIGRLSRESPTERRSRRALVTE